MKKSLLFFILFLFTVTLTYSQVKIGDNPDLIRGSSILELESTNKVLVITRMTSTQMNAVNTPHQGALVYNTDDNCVFMFDGTGWKSLCKSSQGIKVIRQSTPPNSDNNLGDFWINDSKNDATSIWNGNNWVSLDNNPTRGNGAPNTTTAPNPSAGDVYVNITTGEIYAYDGTTWVKSGGSTKANNGLLVTADNTVQLGGTLIQPTVISTNASNTLTIEGLQEGDIENDDIVSINKTNGELRKISATNLFREVVKKITASDGDDEFDTPLPITDFRKVNLYRNGVRIDFEQVDADTVRITDPEAVCFQGDQIRIVQFY